MLMRDRHHGVMNLLGLVQAAVASEAPSGEAHLRWDDFKTDLLHLFQEEERELIPLFADFSERDVRVLVQEHRHIRDRITEIDAAAEHGIRLQELRDLAAVLRAHFRNEERITARCTVGGG